MPLWICLHLPHHSLDAASPYWHINQAAVAVTEQEQIFALTPAARQAGLVPGMRRGTAQALAPQVGLLRRNVQAEEHGLHQALCCLLQYTPDITLLGPHSLALEVSASLNLFGGPRALWHKVVQSLQGLGLNTSLAMAPTAHGAWALALQTQTRQRRALKLATLARRLNILPVLCVPALLPWHEWLESLGCHTLGQVQALPRQGLQQRTQPKAVQALDAAYGRHALLHTWVTLPETFQRRYDTVQRLEHTNAILGVAGILISMLSGWLQASHCATSQLEFKLHHEKGRSAQPPTQLQLHLSEAGWQPDDFLPALAERLHRLALAGPVIALELLVDKTQPRTPRSHGLFPEPQQWARQENRLLDLLRSRLGHERILAVQPVASYLPEVANRWAPAPASGPISSAPDNGFLPVLQQQTRPFWLLDPPLALHTKRSTPMYQGKPLRLLQGPERIESGWWQHPHQQRDYFVAQDAQSVRYWVFRQRAALDARWFLHGLFG